MPCCRCSTPTATPLAGNGRDWGSCDSGWGRRVRLTAWLASPWSWRGEARPGRAPGDGARGGTRARAGCGATRQRGRDRRGRAGLIRVVGRVVGSVLPAPTVRQGGYRVQRTVRRRGGKRSVASRDERGDAGAAGGDIRGKRRGTGEGRRVTAARVAHWIWGPSAAARVARLPLLPLAGGYWAIMKVRAA